MKSTRIDYEVYAYLQKKAVAFEENPNDDLLRLMVAATQARQKKPYLPMSL